MLSVILRISILYHFLLVRYPNNVHLKRVVCITMSSDGVVISGWSERRSDEKSRASSGACRDRKTAN